MEKIKTPLSENIDRLIYEISKIAQHEGNNISPYMSNKLEFLRAELKENQKLLPAERDMIENAVKEGMAIVGNHHNEAWPNEYAENYFNENFKSYE